MSSRKQTKSRSIVGHPQTDLTWAPSVRESDALQLPGTVASIVSLSILQQVSRARPQGTSATSPPWFPLKLAATKSLISKIALSFFTHTHTHTQSYSHTHTHTHTHTTHTLIHTHTHSFTHTHTPSRARTHALSFAGNFCCVCVGFFTMDLYIGAKLAVQYM